MYLNIKFPFGIELVFDTEPACCRGEHGWPDDAPDADTEAAFIGDGHQYSCLRCGEVIHSGATLDESTERVLMSAHICLGDVDPS